MGRNVLLASLVLLAATSLVHASPPDTLWTRTYGGAGYDYANSLRLVNDSGYVLAGFTTSPRETADVYLLRTNARGDTLWTRTLGGSGWDEAWSVLPTLDGGYAVAGWLGRPDTVLADVYLIRLDADGDTLWTRTFGGESDNWAASVIQTPDSGYVLCGTSDWDVYLLCVDQYGDSMWARTFGGSDMDFGVCVVAAPGSGYVVSGVTYSQDQGDVFVIRTDESGQPLWIRNYGGDDYEWAGPVVVTPDSGYLVAGEREVPGPLRERLGMAQIDRRSGRRRTSGRDWNTDLLLLKLSATGDSLWSRTYGDTSREWAAALAAVPEGGYIVAGSTESFGRGWRDIWLVRCDTSGDTLWTGTYGGDGAEEGRAVQVCTDGGYTIAGWTSSYGAGGDDMYLVRTVAGPGVLEGSQLSPYGSEPEATVVRSMLRLPVSPFTIHTSLFDMAGRQVMALKPGANDVSRLSPGVYFVHEAQAQAQAQAIRKVILTR